MKKSANWFDVDKNGLAKLLERRGKEFVIYELVQNSWDTDAKQVDVHLMKDGPNAPAFLRVVDDHPEGWKNLTHAWTLFAESEKKANPEKRGRFNLGEKLVLALCTEATIETTTGGVKFDEKGRHDLRTKLPHGSSFTALVKMSASEVLEAGKAVKKLLPPPGCKTVFNGESVKYRKPLRVVEATLPTEIADAEGILRRSARKTQVEIVATLPGEVASVYEMGIPVVELMGGDKFHVNVMQKVPLNADRDNVTPAYLQELRTLVLNEMHGEITAEDASSAWARDAMEGDVTKEATEQVLKLRFGEKRVTTDPHDLEANNIAVLKGYTVIPPRAFSKEEWENIRKHEAVKPAGQVTPSPRIQMALNGKDITLVAPEKWTEGMKKTVAYALELATKLIGKTISVRIASKVTMPYAAWYGSSELTFNLGRLGHSFFNLGPGTTVDELLLHEFAHDKVVNHLSEEFHDELCKLGSKLADLALSEPDFFKKHGRQAKVMV